VHGRYPSHGLLLVSTFYEAHATPASSAIFGSWRAISSAEARAKARQASICRPLESPGTTPGMIDRSAGLPCLTRQATHFASDAQRDVLATRSRSRRITRPRCAVGHTLSSQAGSNPSTPCRHPPAHGGFETKMRCVPVPFFPPAVHSRGRGSIASSCRRIARSARQKLRDGVTGGIGLGYAVVGSRDPVRIVARSREKGD
jgi:hypothetical protein